MDENLCHYDEIRKRLGPEVHVLREGPACFWVGFLTDMVVPRKGTSDIFNPFLRMEISGRNMSWGVGVQRARTTVRFSKNLLHNYQDGIVRPKRLLRHRRGTDPERNQWIGKPYLDSPVSNHGRDRWFIDQNEWIPDAKAFLTSGFVHEFKTAKILPDRVPLLHAWPVIESQWEQATDMMTAIGIWHQEHAV